MIITFLFQRFNSPRFLNSILPYHLKEIPNHHVAAPVPSPLVRRSGGSLYTNQATEKKKDKDSKSDYVFIIIEDEKFGPWGGK